LTTGKSAQEEKGKLERQDNGDHGDGDGRARAWKTIQLLQLWQTQARYERQFLTPESKTELRLRLLLRLRCFMMNEWKEAL
jgi:hypothetical protein